jgi:hypothetical protein
VCGLPTVFLKSGSSIGLNASQFTSLAALPSLSPFGKRLLYSDLRILLMFTRWWTDRAVLL